MQEWPIYTQAVLPLLMRQHKPHVVHSTSHLGPLWGPGKLIVTVHDLIFRRYPQDYDPIWLAITNTLLPHVLRRAEAIIADSHATKADISRYYRFAKRKVRVIYPGINREYAETAHTPEDAKAVLESAGVGGDPYILCLGPWVNRKNLGVVVNAFALLAHDLPRVRLVITGSTPRGMKGETPAPLAGKLPLEVRNRVHLVGYVSSDQLRLLMQNAVLLAYPSRYEGFGLPPLEAMSAGVPVVASRTPAVVEVTDGAALYANPDDPQAWRECFLQVARSGERAALLRQAGKERSALFSWERCAQQTADLYEVLSAEC
jgi:glycosyltransferase involved in cell wall biosynthesis